MFEDRKMIRTLAPVSAIVLLGAAVAFAQKSATPPAREQSQTEQTQTSAATHSKMASPDETFVKEAASGGLTEVRLGELAQEKGMNEAVKSFGKRMVDDHSKAGDQLKTAAAQSNIHVPDKMNAKDQATYNRLSKLSGAEFDREYSKDMVTDHTHDVAAFRKEASSGKDDSIKNFASQTLPTLEDHLKQARQMESAVSGEATNRTGNSGTYGK